MLSVGVRPATDFMESVDMVEAVEDFLDDGELGAESLLAVGDGGGRGGP